MSRADEQYARDMGDAAERLAPVLEEEVIGFGEGDWRATFDRKRGWEVFNGGKLVATGLNKREARRIVFRGHVEATPKLSAALVEAQHATRAIEKDAENKHHRYFYASSEQMIDVCRTTLAAAGLAFSLERWTFEPIEGLKNDSGKVAIGRVIVTYRLHHTSGESRTIVTSTFVVPEKGRPPDKAEFAACTENLGYTLRALLLVPRSDDLAADARHRDRDISGRDDRDYEPPRGDDRGRDDRSRGDDRDRPRSRDDDRDRGRRDDDRDRDRRDSDRPPRDRDSDRPPRERESGPRATASSDNLPEAFLAEFRALEAEGDSMDTLRKLEQMPPRIKELNFAKDELARLIKVYNGIVVPMRERLGIPA